ncbi:hypothetical protein ACSW8S_19340 (plasmid) [Clostridium perfringens]
MTAFDLFEKYNDCNIKVSKLKKIQTVLKGNSEVEDSIDVIKDLIKDNTDSAAKIKQILMNIHVDEYIEK